MNTFFEEKLWGRVEQYFLNNLCSWGALLIGELIVAALALFFKDFVTELFSITPVLALRINTIFFSTIWIGFWSWNRKIPKAKKEKITLLNDFKTRLEQLLAKETLGEIDLVLLNEYHSVQLVRRLRQAVKDNDEKARIKVAQKTNGRLLVYGEVKDRVDGVEKCFLDIDAVILYHRNQKVSEHIHDGFQNLWKRNLCFEKNCEFRGFQITADMIFHATRYVVGMALYAAGNMALAKKFHTSLYNDFSKIKLPQTAASNIFHIKNKLQALLAEENLYLAHYHLMRNEHQETEQYLNDSLQMQKSYAAYLIQSNIKFSYRNDPRGALESVKQAKELATKLDGTWRYNKGFLLIFLGKHKEALKVYKQIIKSQNSYVGEDQTLIQIYDFNEKYAKQNPDKPWPHFIIGYLKCKKEEAEVEGYEYLERFLKGSERQQPQYKELIGVAQICAAEIKKDKWD